MIARLSLLLLAAGMACSASPARAGWWGGEGHYIGQHHDITFNNRFLQRPYPPYHGWNRPLYGWSSNYRAYYFTPQTYANTPWNYGPCHQETVFSAAAPTPGLNAYGVPIQGTAASGVNPLATAPTPAVVPAAPMPTFAPPPVPAPPSAGVIPPPVTPPTVTTPTIPQPGVN